MYTKTSKVNIIYNDTTHIEGSTQDCSNYIFFPNPCFYSFKHLSPECMSCINITPKIQQFQGKFYNCHIVVSQNNKICHCKTVVSQVTTVLQIKVSDIL